MGPPGNIRLPENHNTTSAFDLFDGEGNMNGSYNLEALPPHISLQEHHGNFGSGITETNDLIIAESETALHSGRTCSTTALLFY